jgi:two-component system, OmpR family, phosphate regulon sensor histidine kinase PhoR
LKLIAHHPKPGTSLVAVTSAAIGVGILGVAGILAPLTALVLVVIVGLVIAGLSFAAQFRMVEQESEATRSGKRADMFERQLRRQREVVDSLADGLDVAILLCDQKGIIEYGNRAACQLFKVKDVEGRGLAALTLSTEINKLVESCILDMRKVESEVSLRLPDERNVLVQAWVDDRDRDRVFVTLYEITRLKQLETSRKDFVANVSHELRTPLTTIRAMSETLLDSPLNELKPLSDRYLPMIIEEVDRLTLISSDLLTLSHAESTTVVKEQGDFVNIVREILHQLEPNAKEKGLTLSSQLPTTALLEFNETQIRQVTMNLVFNAIKYSNQGEIRVALKEDGNFWSLSIKDEGIGIPEADQDRIFERFYRVDKGRSRASGGTGLGLSIAKHIVEQHGGTLSLESTLSVGSTFTVKLPR